MNAAIDGLTREIARGASPIVIDALYQKIGVPDVYARTALS